MFYTRFLIISSSAHLILVPAFTGWANWRRSLTFITRLGVLLIGTVLATAIYLLLIN